jgi:cytochrome b
MAEPGSIKVWDGFVRSFHWLLVTAVTVAGVTGFLAGARTIDIHIWAGTVGAVLVFLRVIWGFMGSGPARLSDFVKGPRVAFAHLRDGRRHLGHNPLGGWMVLALMLMILALGATGALVLGGVFHAGPAKALMTVAQGFGLREVHEALAFLLLALIAGHLGGVVYESLRSRENLARAMVTGRKTTRVGDWPLSVEHAAPLAAAMIAAGCLAVAAIGASTLAKAQLPYPPVAIAGSTYADVCAECHIAFHPSLLPASSWEDLMATLGDHFGEDASLGQAQVDEISVYLAAHSSADTKPARLFARVNEDKPGQITATPAWERIHSDLADATFEAAPVYSRSNCAACHGDAESGWFYPGRIDLPEAAEAAGVFNGKEEEKS